MKRLLRCIIIIALLTIFACLQVSATSPLRGDMNNDGTVSSDDAIYLLRHTLANNDYPITQSGDTNRDDSINSNDAIYLLRYTLSPEAFPIDCETLGHSFADGVCTYCGEADSNTKMPSFISDANYKHLGTFANGENLQGFYNELDELISPFHNDTTSNLEGVNVGSYTIYLIAQNDFGKWGLNIGEALAVWQAYQDDHPLYYWLLDYAYTAEESVLYSATYEAYAKGADRERYNAEICEKIAQYTDGAKDIEDPYDIALYYFDRILDECNYFYCNWQPTFLEIYPQCTIAAPLLEGQAISSGFAKLYQLLLNYSGIENRFVWGTNSKSSGWNLIELDENWYWFDITLAEVYTTSLVDSHDYFCQPSSTLPADHIAFSGSNAFSAPSLSTGAYSSDDIVLVNKDFTVDGIRYKRMDGFDNVLAVECDFELRDNVERTVDHGGKTYTVANVVEYDGKYINTLTFESSICYDYLGTLSNGAALQKLYEELDFKFTEFHLSDTIIATEILVNNTPFYILPQINYAEYGVSTNDAIMVLNFYRSDHPLFYWSYYGWVYNNYEIYPCTVAEFNIPAERATSSALVYDGIFEYIQKGEKETNTYLKTLSYYDEIIDNCVYAKDSSGDAESALWAHSIIGAFEKKGFVCEGYAKLLQLLFNYCNIENYIVVGDAGGHHAWNLVKMDDGEWYWIDATWGDAEAQNNVMYMKYFCATDAALGTHTPYEYPGATPGRVTPILPKRASEEYSNSDIIILGDTFLYDGKMYRRLQYDEVECITNIAAGEMLEETVEFMGQTYSTVVHDIHNIYWYIREGAYMAYCSTCGGWVGLKERTEVLDLTFESSVSDELTKYPGFTAVSPNNYRLIADNDGDVALGCGDNSYYLDVNRETLTDLKTFVIEFDLRITQKGSAGSDIPILSLYTNYQNGYQLSGKTAEKCWMLNYNVNSKRLTTVKPSIASFTEMNSVEIALNETRKVSIVFDTATQLVCVIVDGEPIGAISGITFPNLNDTKYNNALTLKFNGEGGCAPVFDNFRIFSIN